MPTVAELLAGSAPAAPAPDAQSGSNPFDRFDGPSSGNVFDRFDAKPQAKGSGVLANIAQGLVNEGPGFNANLIRDALINPRAIYDRAAEMAAQVLGGKAPGHLTPTPGDVASLPADIAARKQSNSVVAATPGERVGRIAGTVVGAAMNPEATVAEMLTAIGGGVGAGVADEAAPENLKPVAQLVGGLAGGVSAKAVAAKFGAGAAKMVSEVPRDVAVDAEGKLTEDGKEIAAQNGVHPDQVKSAYDHFDEVQARTANDNPDLPPAEAAAMAVGDGLIREAPPNEEPPANTAAQEAVAAQPPPEAQPTPEAAPGAVARLAEAQSEGVDLSKGQATQDFTTQEQEQTLRRMAGTPEGAQAQAFYAKQQEQIANAVDRFKAALGNPEATAEERGAQVQDALQTLRDQGKAGVTALYDTARAAAEKLGAEGSNLTRLDTSDILAKLRELFIDESVPDQVRKALKQQAAKYGLIGQDPTTVEGETTVKLRDQNNEPTGRITFTGPVEPLTITNAEAFRQKINGLYEADTSKLSQGLKPVIDSAVQKAVERAASEAPGGVGQAFKAARAAHQQQMQTFAAKDIVQSLVDWKAGAKGTPKVAPDRVLDSILGPGADRTTNLKKVKAVLLSKPSEQSKAAWNAIQAHAIGKLFDKALVLNASAEGPAISGAKLNTAIHAFGADKLKVLLGDEEFNQLMKLNRIIRNATVPIEGTVNRSGTAYTMMNFLAKQGAKLGVVSHFVPIVGPIAKTAVELTAHAVKSAKADAQATKTLKGIREFDLTQAANEDARADAPGFMSRFIALARDPRIVTQVLAASAADQDQRR